MSGLHSAQHLGPPLLIVPGLWNSGVHHWQSLLEQKRPRCERVMHDNWDSPRLEDWLEKLCHSIDALPGAILVAHSLGCILVAHAAAMRPHLPITAAMLVAPADIELSAKPLPELDGFAPIPCGRFRFTSVVVASSNDPYISIARARYLAGKWGSRFIDIGALGHINVASGHGQWPEGEAILSSLSPAPSRLPLSLNPEGGHRNR